MKKAMKILLTTAFVVAAFGVTAMAADAETSNGFYGIGTAEKVSVEAFAGETAIEATTDKDVDADGAADTWYKDSDRIEVAFSGAESGKNYGVILVEGSSLPTAASDIYYINQVASSGTNVNFNVYPATIAKTTDMTMYISSDVADFDLVEVPMSYVVGYKEEVAPSFTYGDVNNKDGVNLQDVTFLSRYVAGGYTFSFEFNEAAANVRKPDTSGIDLQDITFLSRFVAGGYYDSLPQ